jgi:hypothetical protein
MPACENRLETLDGRKGNPMKMKQIRALCETILWLGGLALVIYFGMTESLTQEVFHWMQPRWLP